MTDSDTFRLPGLPRMPGPDDERDVIVASEHKELASGSLGTFLRRMFGQLKQRVAAQPRSYITATAVGALEGAIKSKSIEGELKEAQILHAYAEARLKHAEAMKLEAETERLRLDMAVARLQNVVEFLQRSGIEMKFVESPDGGIGISLSDSATQLNVEVNEEVPTAPQANREH